MLERIDLDRSCFATMLGGPDRRTLLMHVADCRGPERVDDVVEARTGQVLVVDAPASGVGWPQAQELRAMMPAMSERFEVQRTIPADAASIFRVVSDPRGHVAIDASGMLQSSTGERAGAVGDTFVIHMDREALGDIPMGKYDVTVTITGYEQDRFITWEVSGEGFPSIGHYYGYRLEPVAGGTLVTSIYDWSQVGEKWKSRGGWPIIPESALKATLGILERTVRATP